jgi:hypothetical protein
MIVIGGSHRYPNAPISASPTTVRSEAATPKEAAEAATWLMKYETSAYERSMNLQESVKLKTKGRRIVLVDFVLRSITTIGRVSRTSLHGAA